MHKGIQKVKLIIVLFFLLIPGICFGLQTRSFFTTLDGEFLKLDGLYPLKSIFPKDLIAKYSKSLNSPRNLEGLYQQTSGLVSEFYSRNYGDYQNLFEQGRTRAVREYLQGTGVDFEEVQVLTLGFDYSIPVAFVKTTGFRILPNSSSFFNRVALQQMKYRKEHLVIASTLNNLDRYMGRYYDSPVRLIELSKDLFDQENVDLNIITRVISHEDGHGIINSYNIENYMPGLIGEIGDSGQNIESLEEIFTPAWEAQAKMKQVERQLGQVSLLSLTYTRELSIVTEVLKQVTKFKSSEFQLINAEQFRKKYKLPVIPITYFGAFAADPSGRGALITVVPEYSKYPEINALWLHFDKIRPEKGSPYFKMKIPLKDDHPIIENFGRNSKKFLFENKSPGERAQGLRRYWEVMNQTIIEGPVSRLFMFAAQQQHLRTSLSQVERTLQEQVFNDFTMLPDANRYPLLEKRWSLVDQIVRSARAYLHLIAPHPDRESVNPGLLAPVLTTLCGSILVPSE